MGMIDFFRPYTWDKQMETVGKSIAYIASGITPTVISPADYQCRFTHAMSTFFTSLFPAPVPVNITFKKQNDDFKELTQSQETIADDTSEHGLIETRFGNGNVHICKCNQPLPIC